jgi:hypothetical protein
VQPLNVGRDAYRIKIRGARSSCAEQEEYRDRNGLLYIALQTKHGCEHITALKSFW